MHPNQSKLHRTISHITFCGLLVSNIHVAFAADSLEMLARSRTATQPGSSETIISEEPLKWDPAETAIIICDMWNEHWCHSATRRVGEMAPKMNRVVSAARDQGVFIIHAPSSCMDAYQDTPQRKLALNAPQATSAPAKIDEWCHRLPDEVALPIDDSDGGCDCQPPCEQHSPWTHQVEAIDILEGDAISDSGSEIWNLLEAHNIKNVMLMGVHTNMCVLGRPFGLRRMVEGGKQAVLIRDLTDTMYNPRQPPYTAHNRGTELVVAHIEEHVCPTVCCDDISEEPAPPHVVFVIGEQEYDTKTTLPEFAAQRLEPLGVRTTMVHVNPDDPDDFPGLEALEDADLVVLSVRRRTPTEAQMEMFRKYLDAGKPLVGIRTASHPFDRKKLPKPGHADWVKFDIEVLGGDYQNHYGNKPPNDPPTVVRVVDGTADHPILSGFPEEPVEVTSHLYKSRNLADTATALLRGKIKGTDIDEVIAWTNNYKGGRIFYTSLGSPSDFEQPAFQKLLTNAIYWALEREPPK